MVSHARNWLGEAALLLGLTLFGFGAAGVWFGVRPGVSPVVLGALALLFVGVGAALKATARPDELVD
jgi:hypothetical protein